MASVDCRKRDNCAKCNLHSVKPDTGHNKSYKNKPGIIYVHEFIDKYQKGIQVANSFVLFSTSGLLPSVVFAVAVGWLSSCNDRMVAVALLSVWVGFLGFTRSGADVSLMEVAPACV